MKYRLLKEAALRELDEENLPQANSTDDLWRGPKSLDDLRAKQSQYDKELQDNPRNIENPSFERLMYLCASDKTGDAIYECIEHLEYQKKQYNDINMRDGIEKGIKMLKFLYQAYKDGHTKYNWGDF